jgi:hypothetical protein
VSFSSDDVRKRPPTAAAGLLPAHERRVALAVEARVRTARVGVPDLDDRVRIGVQVAASTTRRTSRSGRPGRPSVTFFRKGSSSME